MIKPYIIKYPRPGYVEARAWLILLYDEGHDREASFFVKRLSAPELPEMTRRAIRKLRAARLQ